MKRFEIISLSLLVLLTFSFISFTGTNAAGISILPATLPNGRVGTAYSQMFTASGGTGPYTFAVTAGVLPTGLTLEPDGWLHGKLTVKGTFYFTVTATDGAGLWGSQAYDITVTDVAVGGEIISVNNLLLLAPWIAISLVALIISTIMLSKRDTFLR